MSVVAEVEEVGAEKAAILFPWIWWTFRIGVAFMGWALFFYWWFLIFRDTSREAQWASVISLMPVVIAVPAGALLWVRHNKRIAARGRRGLISWYMSPAFQQDYFARSLEFAEGLSIHGAQDIVLTVQEDRKIYSAAMDETVARSLPSGRRNRSTRGSTTLSDPRPAAAA